MKADPDNLAARFLLGKLGEEEIAEIEKDYFASQKLFEEILAAENDLIDAYATGMLSAEDKRLFENRLLLSAGQRQRVEFAKTLVEYASSQSLFEEEIKSPANKTSWISVVARLFFSKPLLSFSFAAATLMFFAAVWFVFNKSNPKGGKSVEVAENRIPQPTIPPDFTVQESNEDIEPKPAVKTPPPKTVQTQSPPPNQEKPQKKAPPVIYSLILSPGLTRDAGTSPRFTIPAGTDFVRMRLKFEENDFPVYHAVLETVEGQQIWSGKKLNTRKGAKSLEILIPAKLLKRADYILSLKGVTKDGIKERVEDYAFAVTREAL